MKNKKLDNVYGGTSFSLTSSFINAFVNFMKVLNDAGIGIGSSIRRVKENNVCPLN